MRQITKIKIPKNRYCNCRFGYLMAKYTEYRNEGFCILFGKECETKISLQKRGTVIKILKCRECLEMFPNGAVFELKEGK